MQFIELISLIRNEWLGSNLSYLNKLDISKLTFNSADILTKLLIKYNITYLEFLKEDTGILVLIFNNIVFKIYPQDKFEKIYDILRIKSDNIEKCIEIIEIENINQDKLYLVVNQKIVPILKCNNGKNMINDLLDKDKIMDDNISGVLDKHILSGLKLIHKINFIHGDLSLDNIGVICNKNSYIYVIFDFGCSKISNDINTDYEHYYNSKLKYIV